MLEVGVKAPDFELAEKIEKLPIKEQKKIIKVIHTLLEE